MLSFYTQDGTYHAGDCVHGKDSCPHRYEISAWTPWSSQTVAAAGHTHSYGNPSLLHVDKRREDFSFFFFFLTARGNRGVSRYFAEIIRGVGGMTCGTETLLLLGKAKLTLLKKREEVPAC